MSTILNFKKCSFSFFFVQRAVLINIKLRQRVLLKIAFRMRRGRELSSPEFTYCGEEIPELTEKVPALPPEQDGGAARRPKRK